MSSLFESLAVTSCRAFRSQRSACGLRIPAIPILLAVVFLAGHSLLSAADPSTIVRVADSTGDSAGLRGDDDLPDQSRTPIRRSTDADPSPTARARKGSLSGSLAILGLVLASAYFALLWLRRRQFGQQASPPSAIDLLASRRLDGHSTLHLVRIGRRVLAIGSSPASLRTLAVVEDPEEIALLVASPCGESPAGPFRSWTPFRTRPVPNELSNAPSGPTAAAPPLLAELDRPGRGA